MTRATLEETALLRRTTSMFDDIQDLPTEGEAPQEVPEVTEEAPQAEENPYATRLRELEEAKQRLEEETRKKDEIIAHKEDQIRKKKAEPVAAPEFEERFKALEERLVDKDVREQIAAYSTDPNERELAFRMYKTRIVRTGDVGDDVKMAFAAANADVMLKARQEQVQQEAFESNLARSASAPYQGSSDRVMRSQVYKLAENMLKGIDPNALKNLDKNI